MNDQRYVDVLLSTVHRTRCYTGLTSDVHARLAAHNAGLSKHTANGEPWKLLTTSEFTDAKRARRFKLYLKSGSDAHLRGDISGEVQASFRSFVISRWAQADVGMLCGDSRRPFRPEGSGTKCA